jgi:beta-xylosidase
LGVFCIPEGLSFPGYFFSTPHQKKTWFFNKIYPLSIQCTNNMKLYLNLFLILLLGLLSCNKPNKILKDEVPYYTNPLYHADFPDPDVVKVGEDFYMVTSSFPYSPGLPVYHSKNLVHWRQVGNVFDHHHNDYFDIPQHGKGAWAPAIRYNNGFYYVYYGDPDFGIVMSKAEHPEGPWSEPLLIAEGKGWIDPCPFWDDDGQAYMVKAWARSRSGINSILTLYRMSPEGDRLLDDGVHIFDGTITQPIIEGPKMHKRNGYYYIFAPAGSVPLGWQTVLRSRNIYGPYEERIVMAQGTTPVNGPHQGGWVELDSGEHWFLHFQDHGPYGRILHLNPMVWTDDDWPVIGIDRNGNGTGEPVLKHPYPNTGNELEYMPQRVSDEFDEDRLAPQWRWQANYRPEWYSLTQREKHLRLYAFPTDAPELNVLDIPQVIGQRFPAERFEVTTKIDLSGMQDGDIAGIAVSGNNSADLRIRKENGDLNIEFMIRFRANTGGIENILSREKINSNEIFLKVNVRNGALCDFSFSEDSENFTLMGSGFKANQLLWVGSSIGLYTVTVGQKPKGGHIDIDWFKVDFEENNLILQ